MAADRTADDPVAVISHESAAELYGIGDLESNGIHFTVSTRHQTRQPEVVFHLDTLKKHFRGDCLSLHPRNFQAVHPSPVVSRKASL